MAESAGAVPTSGLYWTTLPELETVSSELQERVQAICDFVLLKAGTFEKGSKTAFAEKYLEKRAETTTPPRSIISSIRDVLRVLEAMKTKTAPNPPSKDVAAVISHLVKTQPKYTRLQVAMPKAPLSKKRARSLAPSFDRLTDEILKTTTKQVWKHLATKKFELKRGDKISIARHIVKGVPGISVKERYIRELVSAILFASQFIKDRDRADVTLKTLTDHQVNPRIAKVLLNILGVSNPESGVPRDAPEEPRQKRQRISMPHSTPSPLYASIRGSSESAPMRGFCGHVSSGPPLPPGMRPIDFYGFPLVQPLVSPPRSPSQTTPSSEGAAAAGTSRALSENTYWAQVGVKPKKINKKKNTYLRIERALGFLARSNFIAESKTWIQLQAVLKEVEPSLTPKTVRNAAYAFKAIIEDYRTNREPRAHTSLIVKPWLFAAVLREHPEWETAIRAS